ncbi:YOS9 (YDR057W) [Zygosaccharomyces parabailii]|nr:YOS9 (YDR057W) [Zygosaccharomyces parabailii]CDH11065.1 uncharacterized protein ZBAI_02851 [Zygosaccharomyces bailii ISA1307]
MRISTWLRIALVALPKVTGFLTPLEDPNASDKYFISYVTPEHWENAVKNNDTAMSEGSLLDLGEDLTCYIPEITGDAFISDKENDELEFHRLLETNLQRGVNIIVNGSEKCVMFISGFWTYEYCPNSRLSQFHGNPKTTPLYYVLARSKKYNEDREFQLLYNNFHYYISEIVGSGDVCDLTGNPRVVEIQYVCAAAADAATIQWIKEVKTCYYEVQIAIPKLCELELLSSNEDKKSSNPVLCISQQQKGTDIVSLMAKYEPIFVGSDFYLLKPHGNTTMDTRNVLLYSGKHTIKDGFVESNAELYENIGSAFSRMLFQQLLMSPSESPYKPGDEFSWVSDILDLQGNFLTRLQFNLSSSSLADITLDSNVQFPEKGNLVYHIKKVGEDAAKKSKQSKARAQLQRLKGTKDAEKDIKLVIMDESHNVVQFLDVSDADDVFEDLLSTDQMAAILDGQDEKDEDRSYIVAQLPKDEFQADPGENRDQVHFERNRHDGYTGSERGSTSQVDEEDDQPLGEGDEIQLLEVHNNEGESEHQYEHLGIVLHDEL